eukprot:6214467-Pleurochrysis_carterae.AAC.5
MLKRKRAPCRAQATARSCREALAARTARGVCHRLSAEQRVARLAVHARERHLRSCRRAVVAS